MAKARTALAAKPKANRVYESMTRIVRTSEWRTTVVIRVWRDEPAFTVGPDKEVVAHLDKILWPLPIASFQDYGAAVVRHLSALPRVAAVEVLDGDGDGGLLYPDWS